MAWRPDYVSRDVARRYLRIGDEIDDAEIGLAIASASRGVDRATRRQFGIVDVAETRVYEIQYDRREYRYWARIDDLMTVNDLVVTIDGVAVASGYTLMPRNAAALGRPWTSIVLPRAGTEASIMAWWGWTSIPDPVRQATLLQASRLFARRQSPFGVAGSPATGSELRLLERLDPDVVPTVRDYVRWWGAR